MIRHAFILLVLASACLGVKSDGAKQRVWWHGPFFTGSGYATEAIEFVEGLQQSGVEVRISQHGDLVKPDFYYGLPRHLKAMLMKMTHSNIHPSKSVVVCHSEPGAWDPALFETSLCPPPNAMYRVGRTMFETDRVPNGWVERLNKMDEIWVPSQFNYDIFKQAGVESSKLFIVPESVNTTFFDPETANEIPGDAKGIKLCRDLLRDKNVDNPDNTFVFLSIFKWEHRKGWDILIESFIKEFQRNDNVALCLRTKPNIEEFSAYQSLMHSSQELYVKSFEKHLKAIIDRNSFDPKDIPEIILLSVDIPATNFPKLYLDADAFVLPSRGEGWGRPHAEAMAMEIPVIATNWSGTTEFLKQEHSYPIPVCGLEPVGQGSFAEHLHANPCRKEFGELMRHVWSHREEGKEIGKKARKYMLENYTIEKVSKILQNRLNHIYDKIEKRSKQHDEL